MNKNCEKTYKELKSLQSLVVDLNKDIHAIASIEVKGFCYVKLSKMRSRINSLARKLQLLINETSDEMNPRQLYTCNITSNFKEDMIDETDAMMDEFSPDN